MTKEIVLIRCLFPWNILISGPAGRCTSLRPHAQLPPWHGKIGQRLL